MDIARLLEGLWLVMWVAVVAWVLWRTQARLRRRLRNAGAAEGVDSDGFALGADPRGRPCYVPEPGVHVYGVGHRHPISNAPRVCVRRLGGEAVFCDRVGRPLRRLPAGFAGADPDLYIPLDALDVRGERADRFTRRTQRRAAAH